jgi:hypothetical protein
MVVTVEISAEGRQRPPVGAPIRVEARDTSLADARSTTLRSVIGEVRGRLGTWLDTVELELDTLPVECTIWAHVDVDRDGRVSRGDFITMASFPVPRTEDARVAVRVKRV